MKNNIPHPLIVLCPNCPKVPWINIFNDTYLNIECSFCAYSTSIPIASYINKIQTGELFLYNCNEHKTIKAKYYCLKCMKWLCLNCLPFHQFENKNENQLPPIHIYQLCSFCNTEKQIWDCYDCNQYYCNNCKLAYCDNKHKSFNSHFFSQEIYEGFKSRIEKVEKYLNEYYPKLKEQYKSVPNIIKDYDEGREKNVNILTMCKILLDSYMYTYEGKDNITESNLSFTLNEYDEDVYGNITNFFKYNRIIQSDYNIKILNVNKDKPDMIRDIPLTTPSSIKNLIMLNDNRIASCGEDKMIRIYDPNNNYNCDIVIEGHKHVITFITPLEGEKIASSSYEIINIWKISKNSYTLHATLSGHNGWIRKVLLFNNNKLTSCSNDKTIKIWNNNSPYDCITTFDKHSLEVSDFIILKDNECLVSCCFLDSSIWFWEASSTKSIGKIEDIHCTSYSCLYEVKDLKVFVAGEKMIYVISSVSHLVVDMIKNDSFCSVLCFSVNEDKHRDKVIFGNDKGNLFEINTKTFEYKAIWIQKNLLRGIHSILRINNNTYALSK